jgi:cellulose biosynthesis protein BcsQ
MPGGIIAVVNNKGGVGKTTATVNLAHALANQGEHVLVMDLDSQSNTTSILMSDKPETMSLYDMYSDPEINVSYCIHPTKYTNVDCLPNTNDTSALEPQLLQALPESFQVIRERVRPYAIEHYDYTIIDCPPNMGFFVVSALYASNFVIVPVKSGSTFSLQGLMKAIDLINEIRENGNPDLRFLRLLINQVDRRTYTSKVTISNIRKFFSEDKVFETMIPTNAAFEHAEAEELTIIRYNPTTLGARAYRRLAAELLDIFEKDTTN